MNEEPVDYSKASLLTGQVKNGSLVVHCLGEVWLSIKAIESKDQTLAPQLQRLVGRFISPIDIKELLPDWQALAWEPLPVSDLSSGEWVAFANGYRVNIYGDPGSLMWHQQVLERVLRFVRVDVG